MSSPVDPVVVDGNRPSAHPVVMMVPPAGQPGHGRTALVRRQPVRVVDGRSEGGYTDLFELICHDCGDHSYLDYSEAPPRLQWLRGPRPLEAAMAAYHKHIGQVCEEG